MSHKSIRKLIEDTVKNVRDDIHYSYGKTTDFNQSEKNAFVYVNTDPLNAVPSYRTENYNYMKQWNVQMVFYKQDSEASPPDEYSVILDEVDDLVDRFLNRLNFFQSQSDSITITITGQNSFIKATAHILTGWIVTLQILAQDDFNYCPEC